MSDSIFKAMKEQMNPSLAAQDNLAAKLSQKAPESLQNRWTRYAAVAACAALIIAAYPLYQNFKPEEPKLHGYTVVQGTDTEIIKTMAGIAEGTDEGGGDRDQAMTPGELAEAMEAVGFSVADINAYQAIGYEMTWAKWWKFVDEQKSSEGDTPFNLASLTVFSRRELTVNTGGLPDEPIADISAQPGADAYQLLMDYFGEILPDWYGGAYITDRGTLMVLLVADKDRGDKTLELEVMEAVGRTAPVGFAGAKYSRNDLLRLNQEILGLMEGRGVPASWGIYDDKNCIIMDFSEMPSDKLLADFAQLDPDGDAILIRVIEGGSVVTDEMVKGPAPIDTVGEEDSGGIDVVHHLPGGAYVTDDEEDLVATEPQMDEVTDLPQVKEPAAVEKERPVRESGE